MSLLTPIRERRTARAERRQARSEEVVTGAVEEVEEVTLPAPTKRNVLALQKELDWVEAQAKLPDGQRQHDQSVYYAPHFARPAQMCVLGHLAAEHDHSVRPVNSSGERMHAFGMRYLGLTHGEANAIATAGDRDVAAVLRQLIKTA